MLANISNGLADRQDKFWRGDKGIDFCIVPFNASEAPAYIFMPAQLVMCYSSLISAIALPDPLAASLGRKEKWTKGPETPQLLCFFIQVDIWQQGFAAFQKPMSCGTQWGIRGFASPTEPLSTVGEPWGLRLVTLEMFLSSAFFLMQGDLTLT